MKYWICVAAVIVIGGVTASLCGPEPRAIRAAERHEDQIDKLLKHDEQISEILDTMATNQELFAQALANQKLRIDLLEDEVDTLRAKASPLGEIPWQ